MSSSTLWKLKHHLSPSISALFYQWSQHMCDVQVSPREEQTPLGFLLIPVNQYCMNHTASVFPVDHYSFPTPNSRHYPPSFSKPPVRSAAWPFPAQPAHVQTASPLPEGRLAASLAVMYLQEQHSSGAGLDQMALISQRDGRPDPSSDLLHLLIAAGQSG